jgi:hypothetical protein
MCFACFRVFRLLLRPDNSVFSPDVVFESSSGRQLRFDPGKVYIGALEGECSVMKSKQWLVAGWAAGRLFLAPVCVSPDLQYKPYRELYCISHLCLRLSRGTPSPRPTSRLPIEISCEFVSTVNTAE